MKKLNGIILLCCIGSLLFSCKKVEVVKKEPESLNISIYLDLSDRITRQMQPSQMERDIEIVNHLAGIVKKHAVDMKILPSKDRMKVFFYPSPNDQKIALLSNNLELDLAKESPAQKKKRLIEFQDEFKTSLTQIYESTLNDKKWVGSDIWGFFRKQVDTYCIKENARNVLVILTDGYIYDAKNKQQKGTDFSYILPQTLTNPNAGLIVSRQGLENLEVLILEVNPYDPKQQNRMEEVLGKWLESMGVQKYYIGETDQPSNTKLIIDRFLNQ